MATKKVCSGPRTRSRPWAGSLLAVATATGLAAMPAHAGMIDKEGMKPWEVCALCHGLDGISRMDKFPRLAGQRRSYIEKQLRDFRAGRRHNDGGQMTAVVTEISEQDIPAVAAHFAGSPAPEPVPSTLPAEAEARARKLFEQGDAGKGIPACRTCHGGRPAGTVKGPRITSQHPAYLAKQLRDFRAGGRTNDITQTMPDVAAKLEDADIDALATYIAALPRDRT